MVRLACCRVLREFDDFREQSIKSDGDFLAFADVMAARYPDVGMPQGCAGGVNVMLFTNDRSEHFAQRVNWRCAPYAVAPQPSAEFLEGDRASIMRVAGAHSRFDRAFQHEVTLAFGIKSAKERDHVFVKGHVAD